MLANGTAVRIEDRHGYAITMEHASQGHRFWRVDWTDGASGIYEERLLIDVDREEWAQALAGIPDAQQCDSYYYCLRCSLVMNHRTVLHRCCEITWTDAAAGAYTR